MYKRDFLFENDIGGHISENEDLKDLYVTKKQQEGKRRKRAGFKVSFILQIDLNTALILLTVVLCILLAKEVYYFIHTSLYTGIEMDDKILDRTLVFFLYFELLSMIIKYFQEDYHFPLRYFPCLKYKFHKNTIFLLFYNTI